MNLQKGRKISIRQLVLPFTRVITFHTQHDLVLAVLSFFWVITAYYYIVFSLYMAQLFSIHPQIVKCSFGFNARQIRKRNFHSMESTVGYSKCLSLGESDLCWRTHIFSLTKVEVQMKRGSNVKKGTANFQFSAITYISYEGQNESTCTIAHICGIRCNLSTIGWLSVSPYVLLLIV